MDVTLSPQLATMVRRKVEDGGFGSEREVVEEALRQMDERDGRRARLQSLIAVAEEQVARGETVLWTSQLAEEIWQDALRAAAAGEEPNPDGVP